MLVVDDGTDRLLLQVFPDLAVRWRQVRDSFYNLHKRQIKVTQGLRTFQEQLACFAKGRKKLQNGSWVIVDFSKVVTHALPGLSFHNYGLALDTAFYGSDPYPSDDSLWDEFGRLCEAFGLAWGGEWKLCDVDKPHCQMNYGMSIHTVQSIHEFGGLPGVFRKCNDIITKRSIPT